MKNNLFYENFNSGFSDIEMTAEQKKAVFHGEGPMLIVAGAGTGKTLCIAQRAAYLISSKKARMDEILLLTFSEKAAQEMEERVDMILPYAFSDIQISTFHSFGKKVLEENAVRAGIHPNFRVLTPEEMILFLKEHLFELPLESLRPLTNPVAHLREIITLISRLKDEDISPEDYLNYASKIIAEDEASSEKKMLHTEMALTYRAVQNLLFEKGYMDMADLVFLPLQLFRQHPLTADEYRKKYKYILVDEFQDTNYSQYQLLKLLVAGRRNLTVVGDDDQSIYKFRGAAISNILNFIEDYPDACQVVLTRNFRSPQLILDASYRLIKHNNPYRLEIKNNISKYLTGRDDEEAVLAHRIYDTEEAMASAVRELTEKKINEGYSYGDIAVLVRANKHAEAIVRELGASGIPFNFSGTSGLYFRQEIRSIISFFRIITNPEDSLSLYYLAASEIYLLDAAALTALSLYADHRLIPLEEVFARINDIEQLSTLPLHSKSLVKRIYSDVIKFRDMSVKLTCGRLLYEFLSSTGYLGRLASRNVEDAEQKTRNIARFFDIIKGFEGISDYPYAKPFIKHLNDLIRAGDDPPAAAGEPDSDAVSVFTVHKAKGLEFPVVIIAGIAEGNFPTRARRPLLDVPDELIKEREISEDFHVQEERRLFYVAMTRSQKELYLLGAKDFGTKRPRKISRFILEALDMPLSGASLGKTKPDRVIASFAEPLQPEKKNTSIAEGGGLILTPMQLDDYITCPLKYRFVHILRIPVLRHHRVIYGNAIRRAVLDFLKKKTSRKEAGIEDLMEVFRREWSQEGFLTRKHEEMRFEEGRKSLLNFYNEFKDKILPSDTADREYRFFLDDVRITGKWDLIKKGKDGDIITTFRSSDVTGKKSADKRTKESLKNRIAVLAYVEKTKKPPQKIESYFLNHGITGEADYKSFNLEKIKQELRDAYLGIVKGNFLPMPNARKCSMCIYMEICPATARTI